MFIIDEDCSLFSSFILRLRVSNCRKKTVVISLWNDLATSVGQELLDIADQSPVIAVKYLRVGDFQGTAKIEGKLCLVWRC